MFRGIRRRLILYYLLVIALIVILMGAFFVLSLNYYYRQSLRDNLYIQARLAAVLAESLVEDDAGYAEFDKLSKALGADLGFRLTLIGPDGTVLADSNEDPLLMENHLGRPEVRAALDNQFGEASRFSFTLEEEMYYLAVPVSGLPSPAPGVDQQAVLRLALPLENINKAINRLVWFVLGALLFFTMLATATALVLSRRITGPIGAINEAASAIAGGDYNPRLEVQGEDELANLASNIISMGNALQKRIGQVVAEKNKLETVVTSMSSGIILTDRDLKIELINPAAEELFELKNEDVTGRPLNQFLRYYVLNETLKAVTEDGTPRVMEVNLYYPRAAVLDTYILPVYGTDRSVIGSLILFHETTELRSLEKMRSDFVANVSHELRTPLTTVRGYTETILHEELNREQLLDFLQVIDKETERLSSLLDDLLDLGRIENEKGFVKKVPVDLSALIREAVERVEDARTVSGITINLDLPDHSVYVSGNPEWLSQALTNIIENSIKHGLEQGRIDLFMSTDGLQAEIVIKDDGPGIPEKDLPYVFERFYRVDKSRSRKSGSTGLGLAIVKHILEAHNADYRLQSKVGAGTTFTFTLPLCDT